MYGIRVLVVVVDQIEKNEKGDSIFGKEYNIIKYMRIIMSFKAFHEG